MIIALNNDNLTIDLDNLERIDKTKYLVFLKVNGEYDLYDFYDTEIEAYKAYNKAIWNKDKYIAVANTKCIKLMGNDYLDTYNIISIIKR